MRVPYFVETPIYLYSIYMGLKVVPMPALLVSSIWVHSRDLNIGSLRGLGP